MINSLSITIGHYRLLKAAVTTLVTLRHTFYTQFARVFVCTFYVRERESAEYYLKMGSWVPRTPTPSADPHRFPYAKRPGVCTEPAHFPRLAQFALRHSCKIGWGCYYNHNTNRMQIRHRIRIWIRIIRSLTWKQTKTKCGRASCCVRFVCQWAVKMFYTHKHMFWCTHYTHGRANLCLFMHVLVGMTVRVFIVHRLVRL